MGTGMGLGLGMVWGPRGRLGTGMADWDGGLVFQAGCGKR